MDPEASAPVKAEKSSEATDESAVVAPAPGLACAVAGSAACGTAADVPTCE